MLLSYLLSSIFTCFVPFVEKMESSIRQGWSLSLAQYNKNKHILELNGINAQALGMVLC